MVIYFAFMSGVFVRWENLGPPPEEAEKIVALEEEVYDYTFYPSVYVETITENIYKCCRGSKDYSKAWELVNPSEVKSSNETCSIRLSESTVKKGVRNTARMECPWEWNNDSAKFEIREDGSVLRWRHSQTAWNLLECLFVSPAIGFLIGSIPLWVFLWRNLKRGNRIETFNLEA
jgi:hypothetical protein